MKLAWTLGDDDESMTEERMMWRVGLKGRLGVGHGHVY